MVGIVAPAAAGGFVGRLYLRAQIAQAQPFQNGAKLEDIRQHAVDVRRPEGGIDNWRFGDFPLSLSFLLSMTKRRAATRIRPFPSTPTPLRPIERPY